MKNESVKKPLENSRNFQKEMRTRKAKKLYKKDQQVYNSHELRSRAI